MTTEQTVQAADQIVDEAAAVATVVSPKNAELATDIAAVADQGSALLTAATNHPNAAQVPEIVAGVSALYQAIMALFHKHS